MKVYNKISKLKAKIESVVPYKTVRSRTIANVKKFFKISLNVILHQGILKPGMIKLIAVKKDKECKHTKFFLLKLLTRDVNINDMLQFDSFLTRSRMLRIGFQTQAVHKFCRKQAQNVNH